MQPAATAPPPRPGRSRCSPPSSRSEARKLHTVRSTYWLLLAALAPTWPSRRCSARCCPAT